MRDLAKEFGLSDRGLAKICDKMEVPRPGRGYWRRIEVGGKCEKPELPELSNKGVKEVRIGKNQNMKSNTIKKKETLAVEVTERLTNPHKFIRETRKVLKRTEVSKGSYVSAYPETSPVCIEVTPTSLSRALRLADSLLKECEKRGHTVKPSSSHWRKGIEIVVDGEPFGFEIKERRSQNPDKRKRSDPDYIVTGKLTLERSGWHKGFQSSWSDGKRQKLEDVLGEFILTIERIVPLIKEEKRLAEIERQERERIREKKEAKRKRNEKLFSDIERWKKAEEIRAFVNYKEERVESPQASEFLEWKVWALSFADEVEGGEIQDEDRESIEGW